MNSVLKNFQHVLLVLLGTAVLLAVVGQLGNDYYLRIAVKDTRDYERLLREKLYRIPGIRHSVSTFVLRQLKASSVPI